MFTLQWQVAINGNEKFLTSPVPLMNCYILHDIGRWFSGGVGGWRAWEHQQLWFIWCPLRPFSKSTLVTQCRIDGGVFCVCVCVCFLIKCLRKKKKNTRRRWVSLRYRQRYRRGRKGGALERSTASWNSRARGGHLDMNTVFVSTGYSGILLIWLICFLLTVQ